MFNSANTEHFGLYAKLRAFLPEIRATTKYSEYLVNVEQVAMTGEDAEARIATFARYMDRQRTLALEGKQRATYDAPLG